MGQVNLHYHDARGMILPSKRNSRLMRRHTGVNLMHVRFSQSCPTCGRRVEIDAALLGRTVACQHCRAEFVAHVNEDAGQLGETEYHLMDRVEKVLARAAMHAGSGGATAQPAAPQNSAGSTPIA